MASGDIGYTVDENQTGALLFLLVYDQKPYNDLVPYKKSTIIARQGYNEHHETI